MLPYYYKDDDPARMRGVSFYNNVCSLNGFNILQHYNFIDYKISNINVGLLNVSSLLKS